MAVEASVIIEFEGDSSDVSGTILVELDEDYEDNLDGDGEVKSTFLPDEDTPVFIIHHDDTIEIIDVGCTDGSVRQLSLRDEYRTRTFEGVFTAVDEEISLSYYAASSLVTTWYGNEGDVRIDGMNVVADDGEFPCYCTAEFEVPFNQRWRLTPPALDLDDDETYTIYVVIYVREVT